MDTYHVVCHECPEEAILEGEHAARSMIETHREETGHRMSVDSFSVPSS